MMCSRNRDPELFRFGDKDTILATVWNYFPTFFMFAAIPCCAAEYFNSSQIAAGGGAVDELVLMVGPPPAAAAAPPPVLHFITCNSACSR